MAVETERKFLLADDGWKTSVIKSIKMRQNYLSYAPTVRVRLAGDLAFVTIKSATKGCSRAEYEYAIPPEDAEEMLDTLCRGHEVCKTRHVVIFAGKTWEIDVFEGENAGLILAEIELENETETFDLPPWLGEEVTGQPAYYNGALARTPWSLRQP